MAATPSHIALAAGLLLLAGCSSFREPPEGRREALLTAQPSHRRSCHVVESPPVLPSPSAVVDSAALAADLHPAWRSFEQGAGYVLLSLGYDPEGLNIRRDVIEHNIRPTLADSVQQLVFAHRKELPAEEEPWGVRLRLEVDTARAGADPQVAFRVGRREFCDPLARDPDLAMQMGPVRTRGIRVLPSGAKVSTAWIRVLVSPAGRVTDAEFVRGIVTDHYTQVRILDHVRGMGFEPATEDGRPVSGWVTVPVRVRHR